MKLDKEYWSSRYEQKLTGWDVGSATPPITDYFSQIENKDVKILIPGAGNAHEASFLHKAGFKNVFVCDFAAAPLERFSALHPTFPAEQLLCQDYFLLDGAYDIIVEQTFFCALNPDLRPSYVRKQYDLLKLGGSLVGLLFDRQFDDPGPPFGDNLAAYKELFYPLFTIKKMELCYNSIPARMGSELFIHLKKDK